MDKSYNPAEVEAKLYKMWEESGAFSCELTKKSDKSDEPFTIVIPPPNVTGSLHIGHALNNTLQDILARYYRMNGKDVLWQPGMDHAGIATQMVVERQLADKNISLARGNQTPDPKNNLIGRNEFISKVWEWKAESGGTILNQLRRLGASCDWSRERFTMDEGLSDAVRRVFVSLFREGLVYRDKRLVNWDPKFHTAISDLEVEQREMVGSMWYFRYPLEDNPAEFITVATTRPETMLGDTAVAVHPDDERYKELVGRSVLLPIADRPIPIIADEYSDPEKGSGAVKITPAHDFNDFEVGKRHSLGMINVLDPSAHMNENVPKEFIGLERFEARAQVIKEMEGLDLLEKIEENPMTVPYGDRSGVVIEPRLTDQWFVDAETLAAAAIKAVEDSETEFVPKHWENTYYEWMRNIQPWCISRQIWWGHRIPAWYGPDGEVFVSESKEDAEDMALKHYGKATVLDQDEDVLDTWFSSALWPFSTLGWPEEDDALSKYYPTNVLVTGFDIIFFWVARMMMMGLKFQQQAPFETVYIHALVRDEHGQKMSKSKGNVLDPLDLIDTYGADCLRFTLAALAAQGRDIKLSSARIEGYRNFITKLWNAARYSDLNECRLADEFKPEFCKGKLNQWIISSVKETEEKVRGALEAYRFNDAANSIYAFTWHTFCDWYLEFSKPVLTGDDDEAAEEVRQTSAWVMKNILTLLHPFAPFVTEEIWQNIGYGEQETLLMQSSWPYLASIESVEQATAEMEWVIEIISEIRAARSEMNVPAGAKIAFFYSQLEASTLKRLSDHGQLIQRLARLERIEAVGQSLKNTLQLVVGTETFFLAVGDAINVNQEKARLQKDIQKADNEIVKLEKKLSNQNFISKAPEEVVSENRDRLEVEISSRNKLQSALERLEAF